jgi:hypothetical protein
MSKKHLIGIVAVLILILAVWLVPMALAASNSPAPAQTGATTPAPSQTQAPGTTHQCPADGSGSSGTSPTSYQ